MDCQLKKVLAVIHKPPIHPERGLWVSSRRTLDNCLSRLGRVWAA